MKSILFLFLILAPVFSWSQTTYVLDGEWKGTCTDSKGASADITIYLNHVNQEKYLGHAKCIVVKDDPTDPYPIKGHTSDWYFIVNYDPATGIGIVNPESITNNTHNGKLTLGPWQAPVYGTDVCICDDTMTWAVTRDSKFRNIRAICSDSIVRWHLGQKIKQCQIP